MKNILILLLKFENNLSTPPIFLSYLFAIMLQNATSELFQIFPELMVNHYAIQAIHQDIQDQFLICILLDYFFQLSSHQTF